MALPSVQPARRPRLAAALVAELAAEIIGGRFPPGALLPTEPQLCERFGVSRTVVREAVAVLQRVGLVQVRQGAGTFVLPRAAWRDLDPELLRVRAQAGLIGDVVPDLLAIRRMVEVETAGVAACRRTEADLARLAELLAWMEDAIDDPVTFNNYDIAFHEALIAATGNALLRQLMEPVHQLRRIGSVITSSRERGIVAASLAGHRAIYAGVAAGDAAAARAAMADHIAQFERDIGAALTTMSQAQLACVAAQALGGNARMVSAGAAR